MHAWYKNEGGGLGGGGGGWGGGVGGGGGGGGGGVGFSNPNGMLTCIGPFSTIVII